MVLKLRTLWMRLVGKGQRRPSARIVARVFRPSLENLEERSLLSASSYLDSLSLTGATLLGGPGSNALLTSTAGWNPASGWAILGGPGMFSTGAAGGPVLVALGDFNGDGRSDPVLTFAGNDYLLLSNTDGSWQKPLLLAAPAQAETFFLATGDFNGDRRTDLAVVSRSTQTGPITLQVFLGRGDGTFFSEIELNAGAGIMGVTVGTFSGNSSLTVGDLDGDGRTDVILTRSSDMGSDVHVFFGGDSVFLPATEFSLAPGPFSVEIGNDGGVGRANVVVPAQPTDASGGLKVPGKPSFDADDTGATPSIDDPPPVQLQTSLPVSGLAVQVLVDSTTFAKVSATGSGANVFWSQVITADKEFGDSDDGSRAQESHPLANQNGDSGAKAPIVPTNFSISATSSNKSTLAVKKAELTDSLAEEARQRLLHEKTGGATSGSTLVVPVLSGMIGLAKGVGAGTPALAEPSAPSPAAGGWRPDLKPDFFLDGADDGLGELLFPPAQPPLPPLGDAKTSHERFSAVEIGQAVLQAMIIVKLSPGGDGSQASGTPGVISSTDTQLRVAELVKESSQLFARLVRSFYQRYLGRDPESGEDQGWVNMLVGGDKEENVLAAFLSTHAFAQRADALVATGTPDEKYLGALYRLVLDRAVTDAESAAWLYGTGGLNRQQTALALVSSGEFRSQQIGAWFREFVQRDASPAELAAWAATPFDLLTVRDFFRSNPEWFGNS